VAQEGRSAGRAGVRARGGQAHRAVGVSRQYHPSARADPPRGVTRRPQSQHNPKGLTRRTHVLSLELTSCVTSSSMCVTCVTRCENKCVKKRGFVF